MSLQNKIIELLSQTPELTSIEIADKLQSKLNSVKVMLTKMAKTNLVARNRVSHDKGKCSGPASLYRYTVVKHGEN